MSAKLQKMADYGISWCESGETSNGDKTSVCGRCVCFNPSDCECVSDECANLDDDEVSNFFNNR